MDRIELLASLCKDANSLVDCGCDHGYVAIKALKDYNLGHAYLMDINEGPLNNAKKNCSSCNLNEKCEFILSDGLKEFNGEYDVLLIAGMGGQLISSILSDSFNKSIKFKHIILEANSMVDKLRGYLISNHFIFTNEHLINDAKHNYVIIEGHFAKSKEEYQKYDLLDMKFGPILRRNQTELFKTVVNKRKKHLEECMKNAKDSDSKTKLIIELSFIKMLEGSSSND